MLSSSIVQQILDHLGGKERLESLGAHGFVADETHLTFTLGHNPRRVRTVCIALQVRELYRMDCYGARSPGCFQAPLLSSAGGILPENLATVLGRFTGVEALHHHHF